MNRPKPSKPSSTSEIVVVGLGSNIENRQHYLEAGMADLAKKFEVTAHSQIYESEAVGPIEQRAFLNQVAQIKLDKTRWDPFSFLDELHTIERKLGRIRKVYQGPRTLDLDLLFWGVKALESSKLTIPHPRWHERSFVVLPLREIPFYETIQEAFPVINERAMLGAAKVFVQT